MGVLVGLFQEICKGDQNANVSIMVQNARLSAGVETATILKRNLMVDANTLERVREKDMLPQQ